MQLSETQSMQKRLHESASRTSALERVRAILTVASDALQNCPQFARTMIEMSRRSRGEYRLDTMT